MLHDRAAVELRKVRTERSGGQRLIAQIIENLPPDRVRQRLEDAVVLLWDAAEGEAPNLPESAAGDRAPGYKTTVTMTFSPLDGDSRTLVEIREEGWRANQGALDASYGNCQGWSQMLCALKAWLEHRINLRDGMYV
jgi:hypothetical protein